MKKILWLLSLFLLVLVGGFTVPTTFSQAEVQSSNLQTLESVVRTINSNYPPPVMVIQEFRDLDDLPGFSQEAIYYLSDVIQLFEGEGTDGLFGSREPVLRAVVAEILLRLAERGALPGYQTTILSDVELKDVPLGVWFERAVRIAVQNGVFIPQSNRVRPGDSVNWAELVTILRRFFGLTAENADRTYFSQVEKGVWFTGEFNALRNVGILFYFDREPVNFPTKAEFAVLLNRSIGSASIFDEGTLEAFTPFDCSGFTDDYYREECLLDYAVAISDLSICLQLSDVNNNKDICIRAIAAKRNDTSLCYEHMDEYQDDACIVEVAKKNVRLELCQGLDVFWVSECYLQIAVVQNDLEICDLIEESDYNRESCYHEIGKLRMDSSLCEGEGFDSQACYDFIAKATLDLELCKNISVDASGARQRCFAHVYGDLGQLEKCEDGTSSYSDECIEKVAFLRKDPSLCDDEFCLADLAIWYADNSLCQGDQYCLSEFEKHGLQVLGCELTKDLKKRLLCYRHCVELDRCD